MNSDALERLRGWRNDAMNQHLYETAVYWGEKIYELSDDPNDAFWLAQIYFNTQEYAVAEHTLINDYNHNATSSKQQTGRLTDVSLACRYLAAQCMVKQNKWEQALDLLGEDVGNSLVDVSTVSDYTPHKAGRNGIKFEASIAHLRGIIYLQLKSDDKAKLAFMEAVSIDIKCYESFDMLVKAQMMTPDEEWEFLQALEFRKQTLEEAEFIRLMYTIRLAKPHVLQKKYQEIINNSRSRLIQEYKLTKDPDVLYSSAIDLFSKCRWIETLSITREILNRTPSHRAGLLMQLACMHHLPHLHSALFLFAQELVKQNPDSPVTWYAVGLWYYGEKRWDESRRFFGKAILLDPRFREGWLAFAHTYTMESEHDQAMTAYASAQRHSQGDHLPAVYIGMLNLQLSNLDLATEYLSLASSMYSEDPFVVNELGVLAYFKEDFNTAIEYFNKAILLTQSSYSPKAWIGTYLNLAHSYRKNRRYSDALDSYAKVIEIVPNSASAYTGLAMVHLAMTDQKSAIDRLHNALAFAPADPIATSLLTLAMTSSAEIKLDYKNPQNHSLKLQQ